MLKNTGLDLQKQLATTTSEKQQLELRLQQSQKALAEAQQRTSDRTATAAADREALRKLQEEFETTKKAYDKLRGKHEQLMSASAAGNVSAQELQVREEREKLMVSRKERGREKGIGVSLRQAAGNAGVEGRGWWGQARVPSGVVPLLLRHHDCRRPAG